MKTQDEKMAALRGIRSHIAVEQKTLQIRSTDSWYRDKMHEIEEDLRKRGIPGDTPHLVGHIESILKQEKYDKWVLKEASMNHRRALLNHAYRRINAYIHEIEQEAMLDLITESKFELT